jgi:flagellar hook-length control protein FliK
MRDHQERIAPEFASSPSLSDITAVDTEQRVAAGREALLASLVQEITVEAPPGANASVDIQFDSRTLEGLHVRVQKAGDAIEIKFSTASEAVSHLLTANTPELTEALTQLGYVAPNVSVQRVQQDSISSSAGESARGRSRHNREQRQGQNRR